MSIASITSAVDIVNMALQRLGQPVITTLTESSRDATLANQLYTQNRDFCLGLSEWDCLMQRAVLTRSAQIAISTITKANPAVVTCTGHVFYANELVTVESVSGMTQINDSLYRIFSATSTTITLYNTDGTSLNSSSYSTYSSGGYVYRGAGKFAYAYDL